MNDNNLYNIAYKHLLYRIHFGFYPSGATLPPVPVLCNTFNVSRTTIHNALKMLEQENCVSLSQGRSAIVTFDVCSETSRASYLAYCHSNRDALLDLRKILTMIFPDTMEQGLLLCQSQDLDELSEIADNMTQSSEYPALEFFRRIIMQLGNPLLQNLYLSTCLFGHSTAIRQDHREYSDSFMCYLQGECRELLSLRRGNRRRELKEHLTAIAHKQYEVTRKYYDSLPAADDPVESVSYKWNYFTDRPQVSFNLAMDLLRTIYSSLNRLDYLPSAAALARQYSQPVIAVRRAIKILNDIGITESVNGRGTRVIVGSGVTVKVSALSSPNMKKVVLPYLQSVQIILLICKTIARSVFPSLPDEALQVAADCLRQLLREGNCTVTFGVCFVLLLNHSPSAALKEILGGLMYFQYLGYPLIDMDPKDFRYDTRATERLLKSLEEKDAELFAEELQSLMMTIFQAGKEKLRAGGVPEAEAIATPSLNLC